MAILFCVRVWVSLGLPPRSIIKNFLTTTTKASQAFARHLQILNRLVERHYLTFLAGDRARRSVRQCVCVSSWELCVRVCVSFEEEVERIRELSSVMRHRCTYSRMMMMTGEVNRTEQIGTVIHPQHPNPESHQADTTQRTHEMVVACGSQQVHMHSGIRFN